MKLPFGFLRHTFKLGDTSAITLDVSSVLNVVYRRKLFSIFSSPHSLRIRYFEPKTSFNWLYFDRPLIANLYEISNEHEVEIDFNSEEEVKKEIAHFKQKQDYLDHFITQKKKEFVRQCERDGIIS